MQLDPTRYGREWAEEYDIPDIDTAGTAACVRRLHELAAGRPVLEVAAGTGRVAIPLAETGLTVTATDISPEMIAVLDRKRGRVALTSRVEGMERITGGPYGLIANLFNSVMMLTSPDLQQQAFHSAAAALQPGGLLVVEMGEVRPETLGQVLTAEWAPGYTVTTHRQFDPASGIATYRETVPSGEVRITHLRPTSYGELVEMAERAGLELLEVNAGWHGMPWSPGDAYAGPDCVPVFLWQRPW